MERQERGIHAFTARGRVGRVGIEARDFTTEVSEVIWAERELEDLVEDGEKVSETANRGEGRSRRRAEESREAASMLASLLAGALGLISVEMLTARLLAPLLLVQGAMGRVCLRRVRRMMELAPRPAWLGTPAPARRAGVCSKGRYSARPSSCGPASACAARRNPCAIVGEADAETCSTSATRSGSVPALAGADGGHATVRGHRALARPCGAGADLRGWMVFAMAFGDIKGMLEMELGMLETSAWSKLGGRYGGRFCKRFLSVGDGSAGACGARAA